MANHDDVENISDDDDDDDDGALTEEEIKTMLKLRKQQLKYEQMFKQDKDVSFHETVLYSADGFSFPQLEAQDVFLIFLSPSFSFPLTE